MENQNNHPNSSTTPDRNHQIKSEPSGSYGQPGWGDGKTTAATPEGAATLAKEAASSQSKVGFSGSMHRRRIGGILGKVLDFIAGKDPDIFDSFGRVRHKFTDAKWKAWDDRLRANKDFDWRKHSGKERPEKPKN